jgi:hypothetical protein
MCRSYDHPQVEIYTSEINMTGLNLAVCILLGVLDQVQGYPSNTLFFNSYLLVYSNYPLHVSLV